MLCSSNNIPKDRKDELNIFKEKVFDSCIVINEFDSNVYKEIFNDINVTDFEDIIKLCDCNIRTAQKCKQLLKNIKKYMNNKEFNLIGSSINEYDLLISSLLAICSFWYNGSHKIDPEKAKYNHDRYEFNENTANGIDYYFSSKDGIPSKYIQYRDLTRSILRIYMYDNFSSFNLILKPEKNNSINIFSTQFFYLSDFNKQKYFEKLENVNLVGKTLLDINNVIFNIINNSNYKFDERFIDKLAQFYYSEKGDIPDNPESLFSEIVYSQGEISNFNRESYVKDFVNMLYKKIIKISNDNDERIIIESKNNKNYGVVCDIIRKNLDASTERQQYLYNIIKNNDIFPNLSGDITSSEWALAHRIAELMNKLNKEVELFEYAKEQCKKDPTNESLIERYVSIFKYRFGKSISKDDLVN